MWTLRRRVRFLRAFRTDLDAYFAEVSYQAFPFRVVENDAARRLRADLEARSRRCRAVLRAVGEVGAIRFVPGERPGEVVRVELVVAAFELDRFSLGADDLRGVLDAGVRAYEAAGPGAWIRTFNPVYWLEMALSVLEVVPFLPWRFMGRDAAGAAASPAGRALRVLIRAGSLSALVVVTIRGLGVEAQALDFGDRIFRAISGIPWRWLGP